MDKQVAAQQTQSQGLQMTPEIRTYLEGLLQDAGMTAVDEELKSEMVKELFARLDQYITSVIVDNLQEPHLSEFLKMSEEKKTMEELQKFLQDKVPNTQEVFVRAFDDFRKTYLGGVDLKRNEKQITEDTKITQATTKAIN